MKVVGVVAEFNPFHNGHKYQIEMIDEKLKPDLKIACLSSNYVQRADFSIFNVFDRAKIALSMGYDIVVEIPPIVSFQNAEIYSSYATRMLDKMSCDIQVFGAETKDIEEIKAMANILEDANVIKYMSEGLTYNKACQNIMKENNLEHIYKSNNILAMEYVKAINKYNLNIKPYIIKRKNVDYNSYEIKSKITSATNIRKKIINNENIDELIPYTNDFKYITNYEDNLFRLFKYIIKSRSISDIYDINDDLKNYILNRIDKANNYDSFIKLCKNKNISINRIKRTILNVTLNIKKDDIEKIKTEKIKQIKVLAINEKGAKYIKNLDFMKVNYKNYEEDEKFSSLYSYLGFDFNYYNVIYKKEK